MNIITTIMYQQVLWFPLCSWLLMSKMELTKHVFQRCVCCGNLWWVQLLTQVSDKRLLGLLGQHNNLVCNSRERERERECVCVCVEVGSLFSTCVLWYIYILLYIHSAGRIRTLHMLWLQHRNVLHAGEYMGCEGACMMCQESSINYHMKSD